MSIRSIIAGPMVALSLASCATLGVDSGTIAQIQNATQTFCGFLPTASTIINILAANNAGLQTAQSIASAICNAVQPRTASLGLLRAAPAAPAIPTVAGVRVDGRFTR